jgi:hypothetical protein
MAHDLLRGLLVGLAAEHHRAQAQGRDLQAGAADRAKLADFEERVRETEDLWGQPFQRGRAIIPHPGHD